MSKNFASSPSILYSKASSSSSSVATILSPTTAPGEVSEIRTVRLSASNCGGDPVVVVSSSGSVSDPVSGPIISIVMGVHCGDEFEQNPV